MKRRNLESVGYLLFFLSFIVFPAELLAAGRSYELAWPEVVGEKTEIFYAGYSNGQWSKKQQLTNDIYDNMHPHMAVDGEGRLWLVWTALNGLENKLFYAIKDGKGWTHPQEIKTGLESNIGPRITVDSDGLIWITWAGYAGVADDVYVAHWAGDDWSHPVQVNPKNTVPDILPQIDLNETGHLEIQWQGFDGDSYRNYRAVLEEDKSWSKPQLLEETDMIDSFAGADKVAKFEKNKLPLPGFFKPLKDDDRLYHLLNR